MLKHEVFFWGSAIVLGAILGFLMPMPESRREIRERLHESDVQCLTLQVYLAGDPRAAALERLQVKRHPGDLCALPFAPRPPSTHREMSQYFRAEAIVREVLQ